MSGIYEETSLSPEDKETKERDEQRIDEHQAEVKNYTDQRLMGKDSLAIGSGVIANGAAMSALENVKLEQKKKAKEDVERVELLMLLQERLHWLNAKIEEGENALKALDRLKILYQNGELDLSNPMHVGDMEKAGLTRESLKHYGEDAFNNREEELHAELDQYRRQQELLEEARDRGEITHEAKEAILEMRGADLFDRLDNGTDVSSLSMTLSEKNQPNQSNANTEDIPDKLLETSIKTKSSAIPFNQAAQGIDATPAPATPTTASDLVVRDAPSFSV